MSKTEIRRRKTECPEIDALFVISEALESLDDAARDRVLAWAREKFVNGPRKALGEEAFTATAGQLDAIDQRAKTLGVGTRQLVHALSALRERKGLAPVEMRESIEAAEQELQKT